VSSALGIRERGTPGCEVGPGAEAATGSGQHDDADVLVGVGPVEGMHEFLAHLLREGIEARERRPFDNQRVA